MDTTETSRLLKTNGNIASEGTCSSVKEASRGRKFLVMLACLYLQAITVGLLFSMAVMYAELIIVFNTNRSQVALIQSLFSGLTTGGGIVATPIVKRFGPGPVTCTGTVIGALSISLSYLAKDVITLIFSVGLIGSMGLCFAYLSSFVSVTWIFHSDPGIAIVVVTIGSSFGQFVLPYLTEIFIEAYNWNGAYLLLGAVAMQCLPCGCFIYTCKRFYKTDNDERDFSILKSVKQICDISLITDIAVLAILFNSFLLAFTGNIEAWFFVDILTTRGYERERGSFLVTMLGFANLIGRTIGSILRFKVKIKTIYHWIYLWPIISISHILAITILDFGGLLGACLLYGIALGICTAQAQAIMFEVCGLARSPQGVALVNLMYGLGNFSCALLGGIVKDTTGEYNAMFYMAAAAGVYVSLSSAVVANILRKRDKQNISELEPVTKVKYQKLEYSTNGNVG